MPLRPIRNALFGKLAVSTRFITQEQLDECLAVQQGVAARGGTPPKLGKILEEKGYLTSAQVQIVLDTMAQSQKRRFGDIARGFQFLTQEQVDAAVRLQEGLARNGPAPLDGPALQEHRRAVAAGQTGSARPKIGELLVALRHLRTHQVEAVLEDQNKKIVSCGRCKAVLNIARLRVGQKVRCAQCSQLLDVVQGQDGQLDVEVPPSTGVWDASEIHQDLESAARKPEAPKVEIQERKPGHDSRGPIPSSLGDFKLLARLGEDAGGQIFKANEVSRNRVVALKVMRNSVMSDPEYQKRFLDEARMAAALDHPAIRRIYGVHKVGTRWLVSMEYVEADSVYGLLQKQQSIHFDQAVHLLTPVIEALGLAHRAGVVHGDIRPSNLLILPNGRAKLANLGMATKASENILQISQSGQKAPFYMAPEFVTGDRATDHRVDIYSLGATLYHMIAGQPPHHGKSPFEVMVRLSQEQIPPLKFFDPTMPDGLAKIVEKMLEPEPDDRFATCEEVLRALEGVVNPAGVALVTPGTAPRPVSAGRRRRSLVLASVVGAALIGAIAWQWIAAAGERRSAFATLESACSGPIPSRTEFDALRSKLRQFADQHRGSSEASRAEQLIEELRTKEKERAEAELGALAKQVAAEIGAGRYGSAMKAIDGAQLPRPDDPVLAGLRGRIESAAEAGWKKTSEESLARARAGDLRGATELVDSALAARALESDSERAGLLRQEIAAAKQGFDAAAAAAAAERKAAEELERKRKEAEAALARWTAEEVAWLRSVKLFDLEAAGDILAKIRPQLDEEGRKAVDVRIEETKWLVELRLVAAEEIVATNAGWDQSEATDHRLRMRPRSGTDLRACFADPNGVQFVDKTGAQQVFPWTGLETATLAEGLHRAAAKKSLARLNLALALFCSLRAEDADAAMARWLMDEAEKLCAATAGELPAESAECSARVNAWFDKAQTDLVDGIGRAAGQGSAAEAASLARTLRNAYGRRRIAQERGPDVEAGLRRAFLGPQPAERSLWADFASAIPGVLEASEGWKAAAGILSGSGREETLRFHGTGVEEIAFFFRFQKNDFRLAVSSGGLEVRLEPSRAKFDALVKRGESTPIQKSFRERLEDLKARDWHVLQIRVARGGADVEILLDGEAAGSLPLSDPLDGFVLTLAGQSQNQSGSLDLDDLVVRRK